MTYNFKTHQLAPYSTEWKNGMRGALWYIQELDAIYMIDSQSISEGQDHLIQQLRQLAHPVNCLAKGFPAALLAHKDLICLLSFDWVKFCQAYFNAMRDLFPQKPAFCVPPIVEDWEYTLRQIQPFRNDISGYFDNYQRMHVARILRDLFNPFKIVDVRNKLQYRFYFTAKFADNDVPQLISAQMPELEDRIGAPFIIMQDANRLSEPAKIQVHGFIAAVINLAMCSYWEKRWKEYDFANPTIVALIAQTYRDGRPIINEVVPIEKLSFALPISVIDLCKAYMDAFESIILKVFQYRSDLPVECTDGDNAYAMIYACEHDSFDDFQKSELYQHLTYEQKQALFGYAKRFSEWLSKTYNITIQSQHRILNALSKDMPQIQMQINNFVKITRAGDTEDDNSDEPVKFKYILSDDWGQIAEIHKRIELHLASPAKLRDELIRLQEDGLISLPMDNPTAIIREVKRILGDKAPKERSFVTTWGRRV